MNNHKEYNIVLLSEEYRARLIFLGFIIVFIGFYFIDTIGKYIMIFAGIYFLFLLLFLIKKISNAKVLIRLYDEHFEIKWKSQFLFAHEKDITIKFCDIVEYKMPFERYDDTLQLNLVNNETFELCFDMWHSRYYEFEPDLVQNIKAYNHRTKLKSELHEISEITH